MRGLVSGLRRPAAVLAGVAWAAAALGCAPADEGSRAARDRVRAIVMPYLNLMPFYIAREQGYFADEGLDVEFVRVARNQDIMAALATGDVDAAGGMITINELNLVLTGARIRIVAGMGELSPEHCPNAALVVRREVMESGALESADGIRRLRFDLDDLIPIGYWADVFLRRYGLGLDDVDWVNLPSPAAFEAVRNGTVDVTLDGEPYVSMLEGTGEAVVWAGMEDVLPHYTVSTLMYGQRLLDDRPDVGRRFAVAILRAIRHYGLGKTPENLDTVERGTGLTREQVQGVCWPFMRADGGIDPAIIRGYQEWTVTRGLVSRVLEDDELYDLSFVGHASQVLDERDGR